MLPRRNLETMFHILAGILLVAILTIMSPLRSQISLLQRKAKHSLTSASPYQAPIKSCDLDHIVEGSYTVYLHKASTFKAHMRAVDVTLGNITPIDEYDFAHDETARHGVYYFVEDLADRELEKIRADVNVDVVECDYGPWSPFDGETVEIVVPDGVVPHDESPRSID